MRIRMSWWYAVPIVLLAVFVMLRVLVSFAARPDNLGVTDGKLAPCPDSPNCVSSQSNADDSRMPAIPFSDTPREATARLESVLASMRRTRIVHRSENYLHAECSSLLFGFVDDVEFVIDPAQTVIHFRSASRLGRSDLGVNRRRMTTITEKMKSPS